MTTFHVPKYTHKESYIWTTARSHGEFAVPLFFHSIITVSYFRSISAKKKNVKNQWSDWFNTISSSLIFYVYHSLKCVYRLKWLFCFADKRKFCFPLKKNLAAKMSCLLVCLDSRLLNGLNIQMLKLFDNFSLPFGL